MRTNNHLIPISNCLMRINNDLMVNYDGPKLIYGSLMSSGNSLMSFG